MPQFTFNTQRPRPSATVPFEFGLNFDVFDAGANTAYYDLFYYVFQPESIELTVEAVEDSDEYDIVTPETLPPGLQYGTYTSSTLFPGTADFVSISGNTITLSEQAGSTGTATLLYIPGSVPVPLLRVYFEHELNGSTLQITSRFYALNGSYLLGETPTIDDQFLDVPEQDLPGQLLFTEVYEFNSDQYLSLAGVERTDTALTLS